MTDGLRGELAWHQSSTCEGGACAEVAATDDVVMGSQSGESMRHTRHSESCRVARFSRRGEGRNLRSPVASLLKSSSLPHQARSGYSVQSPESLLAQVHDLDVAEQRDVNAK